MSTLRLAPALALARPEAVVGVPFDRRVLAAVGGSRPSLVV